MCQGLVDSDDVFIAEMLEIARRIIEAGHWRSVYNSSVENNTATHSICNQLKLPTIKSKCSYKQLYTTTMCSLSTLILKNRNMRRNRHRSKIDISHPHPHNGCKSYTGKVEPSITERLKDYAQDLEK